MATGSSPPIAPHLPEPEGSTLVQVRLTEFWARMRAQFGDVYAQSVAKDYVFEKLDGRTIERALADGEDAKKVCEKAHEVDPNSPVVANELAYLYLDHGGDVNVAVSMAQMAKQKMPSSPSAADALGWAYYRLGSLDSAVSQLKEAVVASPHNSLYQYHLGITYKATRQFGLAQQSFQRALKDNPNSLYAASARQALKDISTAAR